MEGVETLVGGIVDKVEELAHVEVPALPVEAVLEAGEKAVDTIEKLAETEVPSAKEVGEEISSAVRKGKGKAREVLEVAEEFVESGMSDNTAAAKEPRTLEERQKKLKELRLKMVSPAFSFLPCEERILSPGVHR